MTRMLLNASLTAWLAPANSLSLPDSMPEGRGEGEGGWWGGVWEGEAG